MSTIKSNSAESTVQGAPKLLNNGVIPNRKGRPKGAKNKVTINSLKAKEFLENKGFDPIDALLQQYEDVCEQINLIKASSKPSQIAISNLEGIKRSISETLLKYSYKPINITNENIIEERTPLRITLEGID
jgi:uncharacterized protein YdaT